MPQIALSKMESQSYIIKEDAVTSGSGSSASLNFSELGALGEVALGSAESGTFVLGAGGFSTLISYLQGSLSAVAELSSLPFGSESIFPPEVKDLKVKVIKEGEIEIHFTTNKGTKSVLKYGVSPENLQKTFKEKALLREHILKLKNLEPETTYYFKISGEDFIGRKMEKEVSFTIQPKVKEVKIVPPVLNFKAYQKDGSVVLEWQNPKVDFEKVILVKSKNFFALSPNQGEVIFEGRLEKFVDFNVKVGERYYYSIFVQDKEGNLSSPAVGSILVKKKPEVLVPKFFPEFIKEIRKAPEYKREFRVSVFDVELWQGKERIYPSEIKRTFTISPKKPLLIALKKNLLTPGLKSIFLILKKADLPISATFLLKLNPKAQRYEVSLPSLSSGDYKVTLFLVDYSRKTKEEFTFFFKVKGQEAERAGERSLFFKIFDYLLGILKSAYQFGANLLEIARDYLSNIFKNIINILPI